MQGLSFLPNPLISDEHLAWAAALSVRGFLLAVLLGMALLLLWGCLFEYDWKERALRISLALGALFFYVLTGLSEVDLRERFIQPVLEARARPYIWLTILPLVVGLAGGWLLMRAVKLDGRGKRPARAMILLGTLVLLAFGQFVLPVVRQFSELHLDVLVPGASFGAGLVFYIAFIEDWSAPGKKHRGKSWPAVVESPDDEDRM